MIILRNKLYGKTDQEIAASTQEDPAANASAVNAEMESAVKTGHVSV